MTNLSEEHLKQIEHLGFKAKDVSEVKEENGNTVFIIKGVKLTLLNNI